MTEAEVGNHGGSMIARERGEGLDRGASEVEEGRVELVVGANWPAVVYGGGSSTVIIGGEKQ